MIIIKNFSEKISQSAFKNRSFFNFELTKDYYRIDLGIIITRQPIFLNYTPQELDNFKLRHELYKKYNHYTKIPGEILDFNLDDPFIKSVEKVLDNKVTHEIKENNITKEYFCKNSKVPYLTDPFNDDNKSIQYGSNYNTFLLIKDKNGDWGFPTCYIKETETVEDCITNLVNNINNTELKIKLNSSSPIMVLQDKISDEDITSIPLFKKCQGRKIFYFQGFHYAGSIDIKDTIADDYVWSTKMELKKYLKKPVYEKIINLVDSK